MTSLILLIIFGLGMAFFATQNTGLVHIVLANYLISSVPMYVVVIVSLLLGIVISWFISIVDMMSSTVTIYGKDHEIKKSQETIVELKERIHDLELENAQLDKEVKEESRIEEKHAPSLFARM